MKRISRRAFLGMCPLAVTSCGGLRRGGPRGERMVVLGIDGMDHGLMLRLARQGRMPNFARLVGRGGFRPLGTSWPPQSPVAWSNFITGMDAGGHGIFDFLRHDRRTFAVAPSTSTLEEPTTVLGLPVWGGGPRNLRRGRAFWEWLGEAGYPVSIIGMPANYPPVGGGERVRSTSGLGTPDLKGTMGTFTFYAEKPWEGEKDISGGEIVPVEVKAGVVRTWLEGPPEGEGYLRIPLTVYIDRSNPVARIDVGDAAPLVLKEGEWSSWRRVAYDVAGGLGSVAGIVRFYLKRLRGGLQLYASPVNIDPADPATPIAWPADALRETARREGSFYTQGMAEDTKALQWGVLNDREFIHQTRLVMAERVGLLEGEMDRFNRDGGFLFFYFSTLDLGSHGLWRTMDPKHPIHPKGAESMVYDALPALYAEMDKVLGRVLKQVDERTTVMVMSDHGFAPLYRVVHLNDWLRGEGYLALWDDDKVRESTLAKGVDWRRTRAYAVGFNGLYLNQFGREPSGTVTEREREALIDEIRGKLLALRDPASGKPVITRVAKGSEVYHGPLVGLGPDLVVGYARGYRVSWETPVGGFGGTVIADNTNPWSGDHLIDPRAVPGVLVSNQPLGARRPTLVDLPVSILEYFGIPRPEAMRGRSVLAKG